MAPAQPPDAAIKDMVDPLERDRLIAGRVLKAACSAVYSTATKITSLHDATQVDRSSAATLAQACEALRIQDSTLELVREEAKRAIEALAGGATWTTTVPVLPCD